MQDHVIAAHMAREATRRKLTEPPRRGEAGGERRSRETGRPRRPRRAAARALQLAAHRLDPSIAPPARAQLGP
jgi:hypothetical protein